MVLSDAASHRRAHEAAQSSTRSSVRPAPPAFNSRRAMYPSPVPAGPCRAHRGGRLGQPASPRSRVGGRADRHVRSLSSRGRRPGLHGRAVAGGRVFVDIFAAARRRSAEAGVGTSVLSSPDPVLGRGRSPRSRPRHRSAAARRCPPRRLLVWGAHRSAGPSSRADRDQPDRHPVGLVGQGTPGKAGCPPMSRSKAFGTRGANCASRSWMAART